MAANSNLLKTDESTYYFVGTDGQYDDCIIDTSGNGVDPDDSELDIPQRALQVLVVDSVEKDEFGCHWGISNGQRVELFFQSEGESEYQTIKNGYREVMLSGGGYADDAGDALFCRASSIDDEI